jgi:hypothetical protein
MPLNVAAFFSMIDAMPAELYDSYSNVEHGGEVQQQ